MSSPNSSRKKSLLEILTENLWDDIATDAAEEINSIGEDPVEDAEDWSEEPEEAELERLEHEAYVGWLPFAATMSGAFNALYENGFTEDQATEIILLRMKQLEGGAQ